MKARIKEDKIGVLTTSPLGGMIKVKAEHADMFVRAGRFDMIEGGEEAVSDLKPLGQMSKKELQAIAKDMPGYKAKLTKSELIELIENDSSTEG